MIDDAKARALGKAPSPPSRPTSSPRRSPSKGSKTAPSTATRGRPWRTSPPRVPGDVAATRPCSREASQPTKAARRAWRPTRARRRDQALDPRARSATPAVGSTPKTAPRARRELRRYRRRATRGARSTSRGAQSPRSTPAPGRAARSLHPPAQGELHLGRLHASRSASEAAVTVRLASSGERPARRRRRDRGQERRRARVGQLDRLAAHVDLDAGRARGRREGVHRRARRRRARAAARQRANAGEPPPLRRPTSRSSEPLGGAGVLEAPAPRDRARAHAGHHLEDRRPRRSTRRSPAPSAAPTTSRARARRAPRYGHPRADLDADRLAMAGWIRPSGANRSGWLNRALERAWPRATRARRHSSSGGSSRSGPAGAPPTGRWRRPGGRRSGRSTPRRC